MKQVGDQEKGENSVKMVLPHFCKRVSSRRKEFASQEATSFLLAYTPFRKGYRCRQTSEKSQKLSALTSEKSQSCLPCKQVENLQKLFSPLKDRMFKSGVLFPV